VQFIAGIEGINRSIARIGSDHQIACLIHNSVDRLEGNIVGGKLSFSRIPAINPLLMRIHKIKIAV